MIDPYDLTKPWDARRLQEWFLFGVCVAGKGASQTADKVEALIADMKAFACRVNGSPIMMKNLTPFGAVNYAIIFGKLVYFLRKHKLGQYTRINKAFRDMVKIDPATVALEELERIHGVGPKTARMLLLYTRPDEKMIPLDTHILKWLRTHGYDAPKSTPSSGRKYKELEQAFIAEGKKRGYSPKEFDTLVWQQYARRS